MRPKPAPFVSFLATAMMLVSASASLGATWVSNEVANPGQTGRHPVHPAIYVDERAGNGRLDIVYAVVDTDPVNGTAHSCLPITELWERVLYAKNVRLVPFMRLQRNLVATEIVHGASYSPYILPYDLPGENVFALMTRITRNQADPLACTDQHTGLQLLLVDANTHEVVRQESVADLDPDGAAVCESAGVAGLSVHHNPIVSTLDSFNVTFTRKGADDDDVVLLSRSGDDAGWPAHRWDGTDLPQLVADGPDDQDHPAVVTRPAAGVDRSWVVHERQPGEVWATRVEAGTVTSVQLDPLLNPLAESNLPVVVTQPIPTLQVPNGVRLHTLWEEKGIGPSPVSRLVHGECDDVASVDCTDFANWTITADGIGDPTVSATGPQVAVVGSGLYHGTVIISYTAKSDPIEDRVHVATRCGTGSLAGVWQDDIVDGLAHNEAMRLVMADADDGCMHHGNVPRASPQIVVAQDRAVVTYIREEGSVGSADWAVRVAHTQLDDLCPPGP